MYECVYYAMNDFMSTADYIYILPTTNNCSLEGMKENFDLLFWWIYYVYCEFPTAFFVTKAIHKHTGVSLVYGFLHSDEFGMAETVQFSAHGRSDTAPSCRSGYRFYQVPSSCCSSNVR
jgi:hypothetical protein